MRIDPIVIIQGIILIALGFWLTFFPNHTSMYEMGIRDAHKEAFEMGLMTKEIDKDDKVIYRYIETHKLGYE